MDSLQFLKYTLLRLVLLPLIMVFAVVCGRVFFPLIATLVPDSLNTLDKFFLSANVGSVIAWLIMTAILVRLFYDDGKKHAAYDEWSYVNIAITLLLMLLVYFVPAIFKESFDQDGVGKFFYSNVYFPAKWINDGAGVEYTLSVAISFGFVLIALFTAYVCAYQLYLKKHPVMLSKLRAASDDE